MNLEINDLTCSWQERREFASYNIAAHVYMTFVRTWCSKWLQVRAISLLTHLVTDHRHDTETAPRATVQHGGSQQTPDSNQSASDSHHDAAFPTGAKERRKAFEKQAKEEGRAI